MTNQKYDLLVIGAGPAGSGAAHAAAAQGHRVALVERDSVGGTCLNYGCDPTKAMLHTARLLHDARHAGDLGLRIGSAEVDWAAVQTRLRSMVDEMRGGSHEQVRRQMREKGIDLVEGEARFVSPHEVTVGDQMLRADRMIIAVGSTVTVPDIPGLRDTGFITNKEAIYLDKLPSRMAIIGGGPIGVEFAQIFSRFGTDVAVLEASDMLLAKDDRELADALCGLLRGEGIRMETGVTIEQVGRHGERKSIIFRCGKHDSEEIRVDEILVATGFKPAIKSLNLSAAGVETDENGIVTDKMMRTSVPHIWAAGDALGGYQFTHVAYDHGRLAAHNAFAQRAKSFDDSVIPWVTYTDPELAHVGATEEELKQKGVMYTVGRKPMDGVERAVATGETDGHVKLLVGRDGTVLGGHILGTSAGELIAPVVLAMCIGIKAKALAETILPYPTLAEGVRWAAEDALRDE